MVSIFLCCFLHTHIPLSPHRVQADNTAHHHITPSSQGTDFVPEDMRPQSRDEAGDMIRSHRDFQLEYHVFEHYAGWQT